MNSYLQAAMSLNLFPPKQIDFIYQYIYRLLNVCMNAKCVLQNCQIEVE